MQILGNTIHSKHKHVNIFTGCHLKLLDKVPTFFMFASQELGTVFGWFQSKGPGTDSSMLDVKVRLINVEHNRSMLGHRAPARLKRWCGSNRVQTCMNRAQTRKCAALFPFHPLRYMVDFKIKKLARLLLASPKFKKKKQRHIELQWT